MPEFGPFGEHTPEEIEYLRGVYENLGGTSYTDNQMRSFLAQRGADIPHDADDHDRLNHYVVNDPRYEAAVKTEYEAMLEAVEALAKYRMAADNTHEVRRTLEREVGKMLIAANQLANSDILTTADFSTEVE